MDNGMAFKPPNACKRCECLSFAPNNHNAEQTTCGACRHDYSEHDNFGSATIATRIYKQVFGLNQLRPYHETAVSLARKGESIVLILPTGNGKSYCYWAPVLVTEGLAIVVEPLIALISDQLSRINKYLKNTNYEAVAVTGEGQKSPGKFDIQDDDLFARLENPSGAAKEIKFIYITAEKLSSWIDKKKLRKLMQITKVNRIIFDEAYVLNEWSDFRPEHYNTLAEITKSFPSLPYTLASACMTPAHLQTLTKDLNLAPKVIIGDLSRPNLLIMVRQAIAPHKTQSANQSKDEMVYGDVIKLINKYKNDYGIIYCTSRNKCDNLHKKLVEMGVQNIDKYYGASSSKKSSRTASENAATLEKWNSGEVKCMIATTAFGMGIDKPNVRYVVHWTMADSATSYYQQIGRAGRDGLPSECLMYYHYNHKKVIQKVKAGKGNSEKEVRNILRYCRNNYLCRHVQISILIGQPKIEPCQNMCDVCLRPGSSEIRLEYVDYSDYAKYICSWIWSLNQANVKASLANVSDALRNNKFDWEDKLANKERLKKELLKLKRKIKEKYGRKLPRSYHNDLLIEMVIRGFLRDEVYESHGPGITSFLSVKKKPDADDIFDFRVPVPIPEVVVEMPKESGNSSLKRQFEALDSLLDEVPEPMDIENEPSAKEESSDGEEWEIERFVERNAEYESEPFLHVKWKGDPRHTWEQEQLVRRNCDDLYHEFRTILEKQGQWLQPPNELDFYANSNSSSDEDYSTPGL